MKTVALIAAFSTLLPAIAVRMSGCDDSEVFEMSIDKENGISTGEMKASTQTAWFAAGCFWGVEAEFRRIDGVTGTAVGYMGGRTVNPNYRQVCSGRTGHAETVQVEYNPENVTYEKLLEVFWSIHDPTTLNRQGPDVGTQYRSVIFVRDEAENDAAVRSRDAVVRSGRFAKPVVTEIRKAGEFYMAEEYHQQYLEKQGRASCGISPK